MGRTEAFTGSTSGRVEDGWITTTGNAALFSYMSFPTTPSLREFRLSVFSKSGTLHIPCLSKFICATEIVLFAA